MTQLRVIVDLKPKSVYFQLALDEAITRIHLVEDTDDTLRFWITNPSVIVGYFQKIEDTVNVAYCKHHMINIARRVSSGGAVYCDEGVLLFSIIINTKKWPTTTRYPRFSYRFLSKPIVKALRRVKLNAKFFQPNIITVNNKKISGLAEFYLYDILLFHGTILIDPNMTNLINSLKNPEVPLGRKRVPPEAGLISIRDILQKFSKNKFIEEFIDAVTQEFEINMNCDTRISKLNKSELELAETLEKKKYRTKEWFHNNPEYLKLL
ncbi:MAG: lipoate--protein ligase family protein [Candidatus Asgardarchaeia archaeon]